MSDRTKEQWCAGYILNYEDGSGEARLLHEGTLESCEDFRRLLPALTYSGKKPVRDVDSFVMRKSDWETL